jgi:hypothetical protein
MQSHFGSIHPVYSRTMDHAMATSTKHGPAITSQISTGSSSNNEGLVYRRTRSRLMVEMTQPGVMTVQIGAVAGENEPIVHWHQAELAGVAQPTQFLRFAWLASPLFTGRKNSSGRPRNVGSCAPA